MAKKISPNELIKKRIQKWEDEDPSSLLSKQVEKATAPLQWLVALLLPDVLIKEVVEKTLQAAEFLTDRDEMLRRHEARSIDDVRKCKVDRCDFMADEIHSWSIGAAAALGAWDLAGPLGIAPSLASIFTLSFRTIKKIGLSFGFDTSTPLEEMVVLEIFAAASSLQHRDKILSLKEIQKLHAQILEKVIPINGAEPAHEHVIEVVQRLAAPIAANLTRRRSLASVPAMGALIGSSTNAWLLQDVGWAARNIYASRRLQDAKVLRQKNSKEKEETSILAEQSDELIKAS